MKPGKIIFSDCTLRQGEKSPVLSFREKIELCRMLDRLNVNYIELNEICHKKTDSLLIKSICNILQHSHVAVPVLMNPESVAATWDALKEADSPRLQVRIPVSSVQLEYILHMKPTAMLEALGQTLRACLALTSDVEMVAEDASRGDPSILHKAVEIALDAGVSTITFCDTAGTMLPDESALFMSSLLKDLPGLEEINVGFFCANHLSLADACAVSVLRSGIREMKAAAFRTDSISLANLVRIIKSKGTALGTMDSVNVEQLGKITWQIESLCKTGLHRASEEESAAETNELFFTAHDSRDTIRKSIVSLGYDLSSDDLDKVWNRFLMLVEKRDRLTLRELEAIIATEAMQVPPVYHDVHYVINTGNSVGAMSHLKLMFHDQPLEGISTGDGAIDAAFNSIEKAIGRHFELDDFQIQSVTEGREAMGETLVKLRSEGKLYSGRGVSNDIVGAGIMAYLNALNKIVYEEEEA